MVKLAPFLMSSAALSLSGRLVAYAFLSCVLVGCAVGPSSRAPEAELSQTLAPCAENGKVKGSMQRTTAADGSVSYVFTPDCLANSEKRKEMQELIIREAVRILEEEK